MPEPLTDKEVMDFQLDKDWHVWKMDELNWCLQFRKSTKRRTYHRTLGMALKIYACDIVAGAPSIQDYIEELDRVCARLERMVCDRMGEVL